MLLVVEDDAIYVKVLALWFKTIRWTIRICQTGEDALREMGHTQFDLIWLDLKLPGMSGIQFARQVFAMNESRPPIIVVSETSVSHEERIELGKMGVLFIASKPGSLEEIRELLEKVKPNS